MQFLKRLATDPDHLVKHSLLMSIAGNLGSVLNAVYTVFMLKLLDGSNYNIFQTMLGVLSIISVPAIAMQTSIVNFGSEFGARSQEGKTAALYRQAAIFLVFFSIPILGIGLATLGPLKRLFHLTSSMPLIITFVVFALNLSVTLAGGMFQGLQRFSGLAITSIVSCVLRLTGIPLVMMGLGASGAISGTVVANVVYVGFAYTLLRGALAKAGPVARLTHDDLAGIKRYFWPVLFSCAASALLMQVDLPVVRWALSESEASAYSQAGTVARLVSYLSGPIVIAMFPKIVTQTVQATSVTGTFLRAIAMCLAITVSGALFCSLWPALPVRVLCGSARSDLYPLTRCFVWAFAPMPLYYMFANFLMARRSFAFLRICVPLAAGYAAALRLWHPHAAAILSLMAAFGTASLLAIGWYTYRDLKRGATAAGITDT